MVILLTEITVKDAYAQHYSMIDSDVFSTIVRYSQGDGQQILLPNTKWVLKLYLKNQEKTLQELSYLEDGKVFKMFNRLKDIRVLTGRSADINYYSSIYELYSLVDRFDPEDLEGDNTERKKRLMRPEFIEARNDVQKLYEDAFWLVIVPKSYETSCYWGHNTAWCTAYKDTKSYYYDYVSKGPLYININKSNGEKYQFHFETKSFMDEDDMKIEGNVFDSIENSESLQSFYEGYLSEEDYDKLTKNNRSYNIIGNLEDDIYLIERNSYTENAYPDWCYKYNIINQARNFLFFESGFESYENNSKHKGFIINIPDLGDNFINYEGEVIFDEFGDGINWSPDSYWLVMLGHDENELYVYDNSYRNFDKSVHAYTISEIIRRGHLYVIENEDDEVNIINLKTCSFIFNEFCYDFDCKLLANSDTLIVFDGDNGLRRVNVTNGEIDEIYIEDDYCDAKLLNDFAFAIELYHENKWVIYDMETYRPRFNSAQFDYIINNNGTSYLTLLGYHGKWNIMGRKGKLIFPDIWFDEIVPKMEMHLRGKIYFKAKIGEKTVLINNYGDICEYNPNRIMGVPEVISRSRFYTEGKNSYKGDYSILNENRCSLILEISVVDGYKVYQEKGIDKETYSKIVQVVQGDNGVLLSDTKWVLKMYQKEGQEMLNKLNDINAALSIFDRMRKRNMLPLGLTLELCQSTSDLISFTESVDYHEVFKRTPTELSNDIKKAKNNISIVFEDENWFVLIPQSMEASMYWGSDTHWCTATRNEDNNKFNEYNENGPLYININKHTKEKYQFHFNEREFNNAENIPIAFPIMRNINNSDTLANFYRDFLKNKKLAYKLFFEIDWQFAGEWETCHYDDYRKIYQDGKYNFINRNFEVLSHIWFDYVDEIYPIHELATVQLNDKYFVFSLKDKKIKSDAYDEIWGFLPTKGQFGSNGANFISVVRKDGKYNFINGYCELLSPTVWFDDVQEDWYRSKSAKATYNGEIYVIDTNGRVLKQ